MKIPKHSILRHVLFSLVLITAIFSTTAFAGSDSGGKNGDYSAGISKSGNYVYVDTYSKISSHQTVEVYDSNGRGLSFWEFTNIGSWNNHAYTTSSSPYGYFHFTDGYDNTWSRYLNP